jgi:integrase
MRSVSLINHAGEGGELSPALLKRKRGDKMQFSVTIFKRKKSAFFQMQYRDAAGRKHARTTSKTARRDALKVAATWEAELTEGRYQKASRTTWTDFRDRYESEKLPGNADRTADKASGVFNLIEEHLRPVLVADITFARLSTYCATMRKAGRAESTIKGHLSHLRSALQWAVDTDIIAAVPKMPKLTKAKQQKKMKGRPITREEFERLLDKCDTKLGERVSPSWRYLLEGLWWSGLRIGEAVALTWDDDDDRIRVDLSGRFPMFIVPAEAEKAKEDRTLPMAPEFAQLLTRTPADEREGLVFHPLSRRDDEEQRLTLETVGDTIVTLGRAAGIKVGRRKVDGEYVAKCASAHDLRRSFGERWAERLMPAQLCELMRHSDIATTMRYYVGRNAQKTAAAVHEAYKTSVASTLGSSAEHDLMKTGV